MTMRLRINRRRFIAISAAAAGLPLLPITARAAPPRSLRVWTGDALGANAILQIHHPDSAIADMLIARALGEVRRLERVLSLYDEHSALCRLNRAGSLDDPPLDLVRVLAEAEQYHALTCGAFDVTVQPLWNLYAAHFSRRDADPAGPSPSAVAAALQRVGQAALELAADRIAFARPGMAVTLNGIGQGYITDRVVDLLRAGGVEHALVDMGETRALGAHPSGEPWRVGIEDPEMPSRIAERVLLRDRAIATSGGYGTRFDSAGRFNHIFDPRNGRTSSRYQAVSTIASTATEADALSTAFCLMPAEQIRKVIQARKLTAHLAMLDGRRVSMEY
jgi:thiamine biosynthesis lipoprotein